MRDVSPPLLIITAIIAGLILGVVILRLIAA
jgi:hypothetical protein